MRSVAKISELTVQDTNVSDFQLSRVKLVYESNRGSNTSDHVLLNFLNELRKIVTMRCLPSILFLSRIEFNKFNNTGARMLDSIYHMTLQFLKIDFLGVKASKFYHLLHNIIMGVIT